MENGNVCQSMDSGHDGTSCHGDAINTLRSSWKQFDMAGSQCLAQLCGSLAGSQYDIVTKEIVALLGPVFGCSESELVLGRIKEVESLMSGLLLQKDESTKSPAEHQMALRCLLLFVKLQAEYHQLCSNLVSSAVDHLIVTSEDQENSDLCQQIQSLQLKSLSNLSNATARQVCLKKPSLGNNSPKLHKHGLKASLFSFFERKNSPDEGKSSFYVDIDQKKSDESDGATVDQSGAMSHTLSEVNQSEVLIELGFDPSPSDMEPEVSSAGKTSLPANGHVATQEELDSVIDLLSGVGVSRGAMQTIPESRNPVNLQVPPTGSSLSPSTSDCLDERTSPLRNKTQRRSEGSIDFSGFSYAGNNTWPNQHRASLPGGQLGAPPQITYDFASTPVQQIPYGPGYRPTTLPPGGAGHFQSSYGMGFPDPKLNRTWPVNNLAGSGSVMDTINSSWSGGHDSDDLSDDSSVGEQFHVISQSGLQHTEPRRDMFESKDTQYAREERSGEVKHHSLEDLLDGRCNTWPQQLQPWSQSHLGAELVGSHDQTAYHRPISMQMSDPLSRRNIWQNTGAEFPLHPSQSQSVHGGLGNM